MLEDSLQFPQTADDWLQTVVIGGVLGLLGFLILPSVVIQGYLLRVTRAAAEGDSAPSFTDWGELLVDGLRLIVLQLGVALVLGVPLVVVFAFAGVFGGVTGSEAVAGVVVLFGFLAVGILTLAVGYFLPAAVANFAIEDSLAAALDLDAVVDGALTSDYAMAWLLALVVGVVGGLVGGALSVIVVGVFVLFYVQVVVYYLFGRGFAAGLETGGWAVEGADAGRFGGASGDDRTVGSTATDGDGESGEADAGAAHETESGTVDEGGGGEDGADAADESTGKGNAAGTEDRTDAAAGRDESDDGTAER